MNNDNDVSVRIVVDVDTKDGKPIGEQIKNIVEKGAEDISIPVNVPEKRAPTYADAQADALNESYEHQLKSNKAADLLSKVKGFKDTIAGSLNRNDPEFEEKNKKTRTYLQMASSGVSFISNILKGFTTASLNLITGIYDRMKAASPLLQAIESLFQLAMTLFFMPLGNKIAEVMLPAVLKLLDNVISIWDMFSGADSLGEIFEIAFRSGLQYLGDFFKDIGSEFKTQEGLLGSIGRTLTSLGNLISSSGYSILDTLTSIAEFVVDHIKGIIASLITLTGIHYSLMLGLTAAVITSSVPGLGWLASGLGYGALIGGAASVGAGVGVYGKMNGWGDSIKMADGGYVPAAEGGSLRILGEGGEGEYVIPESKMGSMGGTITNNFYITGVTSEELAHMIDERVNEQIALSKIRSGF